uniref:FAD synthase middle domain-containing protein n=1 Tax=Nothoprocta perdicaria TaxID=30464 RepID=A0A8C6ZTN3_NOTPE
MRGRALDALAHLFGDGRPRFRSRCVFVAADELLLAPALEEAAAAFRGRVAIGSYPHWESNYYRVKVTLEAEAEAALEAALAFLLPRLPPGSVVPAVEDPVAQAAAHVYGLAQAGTAALGPRVLLRGHRGSLRGLQRRQGLHRAAAPGARRPAEVPAPQPAHGG